MGKQTVFPRAPLTPATLPSHHQLAPTVQAPVNLPDATDTALVAANAKRRYLEIINNTGTPIYLTFDGTTADAGDSPLPDGQSRFFNPTPNGEMLTGQVRAFQNSGAAVDVPVLELSVP